MFRCSKLCRAFPLLTQEELPNASRCTSVAKRNCEARVRGWKTHMVSLYLHIWLRTSRKQTGWEAIEGTASPNLALWVYEARLRLEPPCKGPRQVLKILGRCARLLGKFLRLGADSLLCGDVTDNVRPLRSFSRLRLAGTTGQRLHDDFQERYTGWCCTQRTSTYFYIA